MASGCGAGGARLGILVRGPPGTPPTARGCRVPERVPGAWGRVPPVPGRLNRRLRGSRRPLLVNIGWALKQPVFYLFLFPAEAAEPGRHLPASGLPWAGVCRQPAPSRSRVRLGAPREPPRGRGQGLLRSVGLPERAGFAVPALLILTQGHLYLMVFG